MPPAGMFLKRRSCSGNKVFGGYGLQLEKSYNLSFDVARVFAGWVPSETAIAPATRMHMVPRLGGPLACGAFPMNLGGDILALKAGTGGAEN